MSKKINIPISLNELRAIIRFELNEAMNEYQQNNPPNRGKIVYGINGLCEFLQVSSPTAIKISKSGQFPRYETSSRKIYFYENEILKSLQK